MNGRDNNGASKTGGTSTPQDLFSHAAPEGAAKKTSEVLGQITWLMSQLPLPKQFYIQDLEWFVMTPMLLQQFRLFYAENRPIGVVLWALASDELTLRPASITSAAV